MEDIRQRMLELTVGEDVEENDQNEEAANDQPSTIVERRS